VFFYTTTFNSKEAWPSRLLKLVLPEVGNVNKDANNTNKLDVVSVLLVRGMLTLRYNDVSQIS